MGANKSMHPCILLCSARSQSRYSVYRKRQAMSARDLIKRNMITCIIMKLQCVSYCIQKQSLSQWDYWPKTHRHTSTVLQSMQNIVLCSVSRMSKRTLLKPLFKPHYPLSLLQFVSRLAGEQWIDLASILEVSNNMVPIGFTSALKFHLNQIENYARNCSDVTAGIPGEHRFHQDLYFAPQLDNPKEDYDQLPDKIQTQNALECASYLCQVQSKNDILDLECFFETGFFFQTWLLHLLEHRQHLTGDNLITK